MTIRISTAILAIAFSLGSLQAQSLSRQVIGSMGSYSESGGLSLSATAGQMANTTTITGTLTVLQGFQQPDGFIPLSNEGLSEVLVDYRIFPNPTSDLLNVKLISKKWINLQVSLTDMSGKSINGLRQELTGSGELATSLSLSNLPAGNYALQIRDQHGQMIKTHKISKQ